jgi:hypothetical protein
LIAGPPLPPVGFRVNGVSHLHAPLNIPVVVFTGLADSPMVERIRHLHVNSILVKGKASPDEILHALEAAAISLPN